MGNWSYILVAISKLAGHEAMAANTAVGLSLDSTECMAGLCRTDHANQIWVALGQSRMFLHLCKFCKYWLSQVTWLFEWIYSIVKISLVPSPEPSSCYIGAIKLLMPNLTKRSLEVRSDERVRSQGLTRVCRGWWAFVYVKFLLFCLFIKKLKFCSYKCEYDIWPKCNPAIAPRRHFIQCW